MKDSVVLTVSHALKLPVLLIIGAIFLGFLIGKKGVNGTIDFFQELTKKLAGEVVEAATPTPEPTPSVFALPTRGPDIIAMTQNEVAVKVWDQSGNPISGVCAILQRGIVRIDNKDTDFNGIARLSLTNTTEGEMIRLILDPQNHTNPTLDERNDYDVTINSDVRGKTFCFQNRSAITKS